MILKAKVISKRLANELGIRSLCDVRAIDFKTKEVTYKDPRGGLNSDSMDDVDFLLSTGVKAGESYRGEDKEIYESDVLLVDDEYGEEYFCEVRYDKSEAAFVLFDLTTRSDEPISLLRDFRFSRLKVLGNIKETPFLLAEISIEETRQELNRRGYLSLKPYMEECCGRKNSFELGEIVKFFHYGGKGIVVGWNGSCNYQVFCMSTRIIVNMHPADLEKDKGEIWKQNKKTMGENDE